MGSSDSRPAGLAGELRVLRDDAFARRIAEVLKAVGHPLRLRIVALLCQGPLHVRALAERLDQGQSVVSQQLRILRMNDLVSSTREGGYAYYQLAEPNLVTLISCMERCGTH